ncbi:MAG: methyltransferase [Myxococcota bacterium]
MRRLAPRLLEWHARRPYATLAPDGPLLVLPGVLDPVITKVGVWLARKVAEEARPGERWIDMGCGTGVVGLALAAKGCVVTCVDVDPRACRATAANAALRGLSVEVVQSDWFAALRGRRFDRVACNVPFWPGEPRGTFGRAMYAGPAFEAVHAFVAGFAEVADEARVVLSERSPDPAGARAALGPTARLLARERVRGEWLVLYALSGDRRA